MNANDLQRGQGRRRLLQSGMSERNQRTHKETGMSELTTAEIRKITDQLVVLREKLRSNGATALSPTAEGTALRKEIAVLNKKLNADVVAKRDARETELQPQDPRIESLS
jgi:hypothetical protein